MVRKQGVESGVVEALADVAAGRQYQALFAVRNGLEGGKNLTALFWRRPLRAARPSSS